MADTANEAEADDGAVHGFWAFIERLRAEPGRPRDFDPEHMERARDFLRAVVLFEREPPQ
jgi:hypothetical protein